MRINESGAGLAGLGISITKVGGTCLVYFKATVPAGFIEGLSLFNESGAGFSGLGIRITMVGGGLFRFTVYFKARHL